MKSIEVAGASFDVARLFELVEQYGQQRWEAARALDRSDRAAFGRASHASKAARDLFAAELRAVLADVADTFDREGAMSALDDELGAVGKSAIVRAVAAEQGRTVVDVPISRE